MVRLGVFGWVWGTMKSMRKRLKISARRVVWTSFAIDISDLVLNIVVAALSGSVVILSQALQGGADLLTSGLLVVGIRKSRRRRNQQYHFGYGRELFFWILMAGLSMLAGTASLSLYFGIHRLLTPETIRYLPIAYAVLAIGLVTNSYGFMLSLRRMKGPVVAPHFWHRMAHSSLVETKATLALDAMGSLAALLGLGSLAIYQITGDYRFDGLGAILVGALTAVFAVLLIIDVKEILVGRAAAPATEERIRRAVLSVPGVQQLLDLRTMVLGTERLLVNLEVHLDQTLTTPEIERLMDTIRAALKAQVPSVHFIQIELETPAKPRKRRRTVASIDLTP